MQQQHGTKADATLNTQSSVNETDKANYLTEHKPIQGTPFVMQRINDQWFMTIGDTRITEPTLTEQEQLDKFVNEMWTIILKVAIHVNTRMEEYKKARIQDNMTEMRQGL